MSFRTTIYTLKKISFLLVVITYLNACKKDSTSPGPTPDPPNPWVTEVVTAPNTQQIIFQSPVVNNKVSFHIFLPNGYAANTGQRYPVLYYLHGSGGGTQGIPPLVNQYKAAIDNGKMPPIIIVFPHGLPHGMWCNSKDGKQPVEDMFIKDLIPYVDANFRTIASRNGRALEGFSMGGFGSLRIGFKFHQLFGGFSSLGGGPLQVDFSHVNPQNEALHKMIMRDVFGNDVDYFNDQSPRGMASRFGHLLPVATPVRMVIGKLDFTLAGNDQFHEHLNSLNIPHQYRLFDNIGHAALPLFAAMGDSNWDFYKGVFK
jgi:enterochelin esterase-like enzyme